MSSLALFDTTLRDGAQMEGMTLSADDKLHIAQKIDELGFQYIEGGWPGSNPKDAEFFRRAALHPCYRVVPCTQQSAFLPSGDLRHE
jgi:2-isopropylmalate synthase